MVDQRILVAGIGNIFLGDDGFGVEVAQRLATRTLPAGVRVIDFGIRGFDLAYALMDSYSAAILVDAVPRGEQPGTLFVIEPEQDELGAWATPELVVESHGMDPVRVLRLVQTMGGRPPRMLVVGCQPATLAEDTDGRIGLSDAVQAAVEGALDLVESLVERMLDTDQCLQKGELER